LRFLAVWLFVAYLLWPAGITDQALGSIAIGAWLKVAGTVGVALGSVYITVTLWTER
jgi:hypothetical protein